MKNTFKDYIFNNVKFRYNEKTDVLLVEESKKIIRLANPNEYKYFMKKLNNELEIEIEEE